MDMTLTAKIKIYPTAEQAEVLKATLSAYRQAAKKVSFNKYNDMDSLEGKTNSAGIRFKNKHLLWNGLSIPVIIHKKSVF
ncbi:helix-turn-helix domain-containing protein [Anoxybacillus flavithermus]